MKGQGLIHTPRLVGWVVHGKIAPYQVNQKNMQEEMRRTLEEFWAELEELVGEENFDEAQELVIEARTQGHNGNEMQSYLDSAKEDAEEN